MPNIKCNVRSLNDGTFAPRVPHSGAAAKGRPVLAHFFTLRHPLSTISGLGVRG